MGLSYFFFKKITRTPFNESPWPFLVSTASLFLTLGAVLLIDLFFFDYSEKYQMMMLSFLKTRKPNFLLNLTKNLKINISDNTINYGIIQIQRHYSNQATFDKLVSRKKSTDIDSLTEDSMCGNLVEPISKSKVSLHQIDLMLQQSYKKCGLTLCDLINDFNLNSFFIPRPNLRLIHSQLQNNTNNGILYQRSNTLGELTCIEACRRNFSFLRSMDMTWGKNIDPHSAALTGNARPDYACSIVYSNRKVHYYHADLKKTSLKSFESMIYHSHPHSIINTNIYWIDDMRFNNGYVFRGLTKIRLEDSYNGIIQFYKKLDPSLAKEMYLNSQHAFNKFKQTGLAQDYNDIPINTPKFIFTPWITKLF